MKDKIEVIDEKRLKDFLLELTEKNPEIKKEFLEKFDDMFVDKNYYRNKLSDIFELGEGRDFELHEIYELNHLETPLIEFLNKDIVNLIEIKEYEFALELLLNIGEKIDNKIYDDDSHYYIVEEYGNVSNRLLDLECLDKEDEEKLLKITFLNY